MKKTLLISIASLILLFQHTTLLSQGGGYGWVNLSEAEKYLAEILYLYDLEANKDIFIEKNNSIPSARAIIKNEKRYIEYNENWIKNLSNSNKNINYWTKMGILCHEIGHHLKGHTLDLDGHSTAPLELAADKWAGGALYKLGATMEEAKTSYANLPKFKIGGYPSQQERVNSMLSGYVNAQALVENFKTKYISVVEIGGKHYKTFKYRNNVGTLQWMADNLNYEYGNSSCHKGDCEKYGREYSVIDASKVCQAVGWRLPTRNEWKALNGNIKAIGDFFIVYQSYWTSDFYKKKILGDYMYYSSYFSSESQFLIIDAPSYSKKTCRCVKDIE